MRTKALLKIRLRNKGIEVLPKRYHPNGKVTLSFTLPKSIMKKFKALKILHGKREDFFQLILNQFKFKACDIKETWYSEEFEEYISDNVISLSKKLTHADYLFTSMIVSEQLYLDIKNIAEYYRITKSSFIRVLIEQFYKKNVTNATKE